MGSKKKFTVLVQSIHEQLSDCDPGNKDVLAKVGASLEKALKTVPAKSPVKKTLQLALKTLVSVFQGKAPDPARTLRSIALALESIGTFLTSRSKKRDELLVGAETQITDSLNPSSSEPLKLDKMVSVLIGISPDNIDMLKNIHLSLKTALDTDALDSDERDPMAAALKTLAGVVSGKSKNPADCISSACDLLGTALELREDKARSVEVEKHAQDTSDSPDQEVDFPELDAPPPVAPPDPVDSEEPSEAPAAMCAVLPDDTDMDLMKEFIVECLDHITNAEAALLDLENNPKELETINVVFRAYHTIKGTSGFLGLDYIQKLAHLSENLLDRAREDQIVLTGGYADLCLRSCDHLREMIESLAEATPGDDLVIPGELNKD